MDPIGNIYKLDEQTVSNQPEYVTQEDADRLDDFLSRRAERDTERREKYLKRYGVLVWDSGSKGKYTKPSGKDVDMGIDDIGVLSGQDGPQTDEEKERSAPAPTPEEIAVREANPEPPEEVITHSQGDPGDEHVTTQEMIDEAVDPGDPRAYPSPETPAEPSEVDARPGEPAYPGTEAEPAEAATLTPGPSGMPAEGALATPLPPEQTQTAPEPDSGWEPSGENKET